MLSVKLEGWLLHRGVRKGNSGILLNIYHGIFFSYLCNNPSAFCLLIRLPLLSLLLVFSLFCLSLYLCLWLSLSVSRCKTNIFLCFPFPLSLFFPFYAYFQVEALVLMLLLSRFSRVRLCATPETAAHQAPPSLGFSRQEHWSGLPFPSPMHESEKLKWNRSVMSDS